MWIHCALCFNLFKSSCVLPNSRFTVINSSWPMLEQVSVLSRGQKDQPVGLYRTVHSHSAVAPVWFSLSASLQPACSSHTSSASSTFHVQSEGSPVNQVIARVTSTYYVDLFISQTIGKCQFVWVSELLSGSFQGSLRTIQGAHPTGLSVKWKSLRITAMQEGLQIHPQSFYSLRFDANYQDKHLIQAVLADCGRASHLSENHLNQTWHNESHVSL